MKRWRGLKDLVQDAVDHGATAIEKVHRTSAATPFQLLEQVPGLERPARVAHGLHDLALSGSYGMVRLVTRQVGKAIDQVLDVMEAPSAREP
ncbi:hypothetical protein DRW03_07040 [Corallococcus sp. H22C18031201]|nr:hypothetical protein DRW03_07040 [Corallococcus sp. H22C18031201]